MYPQYRCTTFAMSTQSIQAYARRIETIWSGDHLVAKAPCATLRVTNADAPGHMLAGGISECRLLRTAYAPQERLLPIAI
ncbi:hypothetical protein GCM10010267_57500 [Streptomyces griseorubens]|nr:hypothetical protein GCM10010267_57500 [Streptomyces griseorubens]